MVEWTPENLWVVAENQFFGYEACDSLGGHLQTYETQEEAERVANDLIEDLNNLGLEGYDSESWAGALLFFTDIADNQEVIIFPDETCRYDAGEEGCKCMTIKDFRRRFPRYGYRNQLKEEEE